MRDFLLQLIRALVDNPDQIILDQREEADKIIFTLQTARADIGKVIGKDGKHAHAIRTLLSAVAAQEGKRAIFEVAD